MRIGVIGLLLGAAINVAVAWGCALWSPPPAGGGTAHVRPPATVAGLVPPAWIAGGPDGQLGECCTVVRMFGLKVHVLDLLVKVQNPAPGDWTPFETSPPSNAPNYYGGMFRFIEAGWPLASMECHTRVPRPGAVERPGWHDAVVPPAFLRPSDHSLQNRPAPFWNPAPLRPIWRGFAINTLVYGAAFWMLLGGAGTLRRRWRGWHARCLACGYPVRGLAACPECGATPVTAAPTAE